MQDACEIGDEQWRGLPRVLLVFNDENVLVGLLRRRDIMRGLEPNFLRHKEMDYRKKLWDVQIDPNLSEISYEKMIEGICEQTAIEVSTLMRPINAWVDCNDHMMKAIYEMVDNNLSILPVLDGDKVVGVLRSVEVFREAAEFVMSK